jgi:hypothetical protein
MLTGQGISQLVAIAKDPPSSAPILAKSIDTPPNAAEVKGWFQRLFAK